VGDPALAGHRETEGPPEGLDIGGLAGGEDPGLRVRLEPAGVLLQHLGRVESGIEADRDEEGGASQVGVRANQARKLGEAPVQGRAELGEGTAGEDEGEGEGAAAPGGEPAFPALGIQETHVGDHAPGSEGALGDPGGLGRQRPGSRPFQGLEERRRVTHHQHALDQVTGLEAPQQPLLPDREGHHHGVHEAGDVVVADQDLVSLRVDGQDLAREGMAPALGSAAAGPGQEPERRPREGRAGRWVRPWHRQGRQGYHAGGMVYFMVSRTRARVP
jgi:hypothetical protein